MNGATLFADIPGFKSQAIISRDTYRPDLLLSGSNGSLYVVELTVGYETNLENNVKRKKAKYRELVFISHLCKSLTIGHKCSLLSWFSVAHKCLIQN